jgi:hypothetical protein
VTTERAEKHGNSKEYLGQIRQISELELLFETFLVYGLEEPTAHFSIDFEYVPADCVRFFGIKDLAHFLLLSEFPEHCSVLGCPTHPNVRDQQSVVERIL